MTSRVPASAARTRPSSARRPTNPLSSARILLSFTFSFDDYVVPAFTNGTTNTWPIVLYSAVRFGLTPAVNALATIMLGLTLVAVVVTAVVLRRSRARVGPQEVATLPL